MSKPLMRRLMRPLLFFVITLAMFALQRAFFMLFYPEIYSEVTRVDRWLAIWHGLPMDASAAGYLSIFPWILGVFSLFSKGYPADRYKKAITYTALGYSVIVAVLVGTIACLDLVLYPYWGFKLDATPLFYFFSAPAAVMRSVPWYEWLEGLMGILLWAGIWFSAYRFTWVGGGTPGVLSQKERIGGIAALAVWGSILFLFIRGGVTVSTMNLSRAYFSSDQRLNHAAINPVFSLLQSITKQQATGLDRYIYFESDELETHLKPILPVSEAVAHRWHPGDSILSTPRPDILIVIMESFSSHLMPSLHGEPIAVKLDSIARTGLLFPEAYACSFRTDRALPAILNAYPGVPDRSIMKNVADLEHLPSLGQELKEAGYDTEYYYGGDLNFTNMKALLVSGGFDRIVGDKDFPVSKRLGKWGAHDDALFRLVKEEPVRRDPERPMLRVIQTSSSHEPFDVPYRKLADKRANAFAFTDSVVADYIETVRGRPNWKNTLVILVPDHYGAYPDRPAAMIDRHRIPIVMTGGALRLHGVVEGPVSQTDIVPSLLALMGLDYGKFPYGRNVFDSRQPRAAYFSEPEMAMMVTDNGYANMNIETAKTEEQEGDDIVESQLKAWLQYVASQYHNSK